MENPDKTIRSLLENLIEISDFLPPAPPRDRDYGIGRLKQLLPAEFRGPSGYPDKVDAALEELVENNHNIISSRVEEVVIRCVVNSLRLNSFNEIVGDHHIVEIFGLDPEIDLKEMLASDVTVKVMNAGGSEKLKAKLAPVVDVFPDITEMKAIMAANFWKPHEAKLRKEHEANEQRKAKEFKTSIGKLKTLLGRMQQQVESLESGSGTPRPEVPGPK